MSLSLKTYVALILAAIVEFGNHIIPVLPPVWAAFVAGILGVIGLYLHGKVVKAARSAGARV